MFISILKQKQKRIPQSHFITDVWEKASSSSPTTRKVGFYFHFLLSAEFSSGRAGRAKFSARSWFYENIFLFSTFYDVLLREHFFGIRIKSWWNETSRRHLAKYGSNYMLYEIRWEVIINTLRKKNKIPFLYLIFDHFAPLEVISSMNKKYYLARVQCYV